MTTPHIATTTRKVLWVQVWALALVQGAIALMWVIYNLYLVDLLTRVGLSSSLATGLLLVENILAMVVEPLMGSLSDRWQQRLGTRLPLIGLGMILAAGTFVSIPLIVVGGLSLAVSWVLPLLLIAWALTMTVFRSPAMSLLGRYAFGTRLPQAASILTLVGGVAGAMGPLANEQILNWGAVPAFGLGSGVLLVAMVALWLSVPPAPSERQPDPAATTPTAIAWPALAAVFGAGVGVTLGFRLLMFLFSRVLNAELPDSNAGFVLGAIFVALALTAIPAGTVAVQIGNRRAMIGGLAALATVCVLVATVRHPVSAIALAIVFGAAFSLVANGTIPFALSMVPKSKAGLGTGMFFSGGAAAASVFGTVVDTLQRWPVGSAVALGVLAWLLAGSCIGYAPRRFTSVS